MPRDESARPGPAYRLEKVANGIVRTTVDLVLVPVTVMDGANRIVTGLGQETFHLFEDKDPQPIKNFLGYSPSNSRRDGKWRKVKVRVALPRGIPALYVLARTGYYGPTE
jgi:hypothetical protein